MKRDNPLIKLEALGQSVWVDVISRAMLDKGELERLIDEDGVSGVTSNPTIFRKAIESGEDYDASIRALARRGRPAEGIFESLEVEDLQRAADLLRPVYEAADGHDGFVSIEVSPRLARDAEATIVEGRALWRAVARPNLMVKVPGTVAGLQAIAQLISEGINVNVTLLFGLSRYHQVTQACLEGLERLSASGGALNRVASVASFFLSRIDVLIDPMLEGFIQEGGKQGQLAERLRGQAAVASARVAYQVWREVFEGGRFKALAEKGARAQKLLWASTATKNPQYKDIKYIEPIIAPQTINTMTLETVEAYRDHGDPAVRILENVSESYWVLERLKELGLEMGSIALRLENEGIERFRKDYESALKAVEGKIPIEGKMPVEENIQEIREEAA